MPGFQHYTTLPKPLSDWVVASAAARGLSPSHEIARRLMASASAEGFDPKSCQIRGRTGRRSPAAQARRAARVKRAAAAEEAARVAKRHADVDALIERIPEMRREAKERAEYEAWCLEQGLWWVNAKQIFVLINRDERRGYWRLNEAAAAEGRIEVLKDAEGKPVWCDARGNIQPGPPNHEAPTSEAPTTPRRPLELVDDDKTGAAI